MFVLVDTEHFAYIDVMIFSHSIGVISYYDMDLKCGWKGVNPDQLALIWIYTFFTKEGTEFFKIFLVT